MSMNRNKDNAYLNQYADNAIKRGYEIYDEWNDKKLDSRKIASTANDTVKLFNESKTVDAFVDALSYIFALDARIKEKYNDILRRLFSYFPWRRELRALNSLKSALNIPLVDKDIREVIACEIERLVEKLKNGWDEDGDDEVHGGKRNGKAEEEAVFEEKETEAAEEKNEDVPEEAPEKDELSENEEAEAVFEKKEEMPVEQIPQEEVNEAIGEEKETAEPQQEEAEIEATDKKEELSQETAEAPKEENNAPEVESEPSTDKKEEAKADDEAVDSPPLYEEVERERIGEKISLIDEMIIDDMVKGDKSIIGYRSVQQMKDSREAVLARDTAAAQNEEGARTDKDDYLDDKTLPTAKDDTQQTVKVESERAKETIQNKVNINSGEQERTPISEMLQSDNTNADRENIIANELNATMSLESKVAYIRMQENMMKEQVHITLQELGMDDQVEIIGISEPEEISPPSVTRNKK